MKISAILWDYDGTLVNSVKKNIEVTKEVLKNFIPDLDNNLPKALTSVENYEEANYKYKNWRELYKFAYGLTDEQIDEAGKLWSPYQLKDTTLPDMFDEMDEVVKKLSNIKQGICSQNCSKNIYNTLKHYNVEKSFHSIIGYEDISYTEQKPNPTGFLKCVERLDISLDDSTLIYIGDHQEDTIFGKNAEDFYKSKGYNTKVICISASYSGNTPSDWIVKPDFTAYSATYILDIINKILNN